MTQPPAQQPTRNANRLRTWVLVVMAVAILLPSMYGFVGKFIEFVHVFRGAPDGAFAITPIVNYLLASLGFLMLLVWAAWNGMFHDVERPKHTLLENERRLDRQAAADADRRRAAPAPH